MTHAEYQEYLKRVYEEEEKTQKRASIAALLSILFLFSLLLISSKSFHYAFTVTFLVAPITAFYAVDAVCWWNGECVDD